MVWNYFALASYSFLFMHDSVNMPLESCWYFCQFMCI